ncbi:hypothetical protein C8R43DRAFT_942168 [Mycena crocata]|nr:hypothetical protein C8R43DRAFT_942168 [Mycena crocata]
MQRQFRSSVEDIISSHLTSAVSSLGSSHQQSARLPCANTQCRPVQNGNRGHMRHAQCIQQFCKGFCWDSVTVCHAPQHNRGEQPAVTSSVTILPPSSSPTSLPPSPSSVASGSSSTLTFAKLFGRQVDPSYALSLQEKDFELNATAGQAAMYKKAIGQTIQVFWFFADNEPAKVYHLITALYPLFHPKNSSPLVERFGRATLIFEFWTGSLWVGTDGPVTVKTGRPLPTLTSKRKLSFDLSTPVSPSPQQLSRTDRPIIAPLVFDATQNQDVIEISDSDSDSDNEDFSATASSPLKRIHIKLEEGSVPIGFRAMAVMSGLVPEKFKTAFNQTSFNSSTFYDNCNLWNDFPRDALNKAIGHGQTPAGEWIYNVGKYGLSIEKKKKKKKKTTTDKGKGRAYSLTRLDLRLCNLLPSFLRRKHSIRLLNLYPPATRAQVNRIHYQQLLKHHYGVDKLPTTPTSFDNALTAILKASGGDDPTRRVDTYIRQLFENGCLQAPVSEQVSEPSLPLSPIEEDHPGSSMSGVVQNESIDTFTSEKVPTGAINNPSHPHPEDEIDKDTVMSGVISQAIDQVVDLVEQKDDTSGDDTSGGVHDQVTQPDDHQGEEPNLTSLQDKVVPQSHSWYGKTEDHCDSVEWEFISFGILDPEADTAPNQPKVVVINYVGVELGEVAICRWNLLDFDYWRYQPTELLGRRDIPSSAYTWNANTRSLLIAIFANNGAVRQTRTWVAATERRSNPMSVEQKQSLSSRSIATGAQIGPEIVTATTPAGLVSFGLSELSSLTPSPAELEFHRALRSSVSQGRDLSSIAQPQFASSRRIRGESGAAASVASTHQSKRRSVTIEEVDDEDDPIHMRQERAVRKKREEIEKRRLEENPLFNRRSSSELQCQTGHGKSHPASSCTSARHVPLPASGSSSQSSQVPCNTPSTTAAAPASVASFNSFAALGRIDEDEEDRPASWNDSGLRAVARETIVRDRAERETMAASHSRREEIAAAERRLRDLRVADDEAVAAEIMARELQIEEDTSLARQLADDLEQAGRLSRRIFKTQRAIDEEESKAAELEKAAAMQRALSERNKAALKLNIEKAASEHAALSSATSKPSRKSHIRTPKIVPAQERSSVDEHIVHKFTDRVILQQYCLQDLMKSGESRIPDQGIDWDNEARPLKEESRAIKNQLESAFSPKMGSHEEKEPPREEFYERPGTAPTTKGSIGPVAAAPGPNDGGGGSSSDSDSTESSDSTYRHESNYSRSGSSDSVFDYELSSQEVQGSNAQTAAHMHCSTKYKALEDPSTPGAGSSGNPTDSTSSVSSGQTPRKNPKKSDRKHRKHRDKNARRNHHSHGARDHKMHLVEPGDPLRAGVPARQMHKWCRSLHHHYEKFLSDTLGTRNAVSTVFDENCNLKFPVPPTYAGSGDINKFDEHILSIGRWLELMGLGGKENDHKRVLTHGFYLVGAAKDWYENQVVGMYRMRRKWTYQQLVIGLFDRFIDTSCIQKATDSFWTARYSPEIWVQGFYHELMTAARRMVKRPDSYTFKTQFMSQMSADMVDDLIDRNVTAETSTINEILDAATNYEWHRNISKKYAAHRQSTRMQASTEDTTRNNAQSSRPTGQTRDSPRMAAGRRDNTRTARFAKRELEQNEPRTRDFCPDNTASKPAAARDGGGKPRPYPKPNAQASGSKKVSCYTCGGPHYQNECPNNKRGPMLFNVKEEDVPAGDIDARRGATSAAGEAQQPEQLRHIVEDYEGPNDTGGEGDQYDSDYTAEEYSEYSYGENDERCAHMVDVEYDEMFEEDINWESEPPLMDCSDSDDETESTVSTELESETADLGEYPESDVSVELVEVTPEDIGLFGLCDDYSDDEFVTAREVDDLAREIAECLMETGEPEMVLEYFSGGREAELRPASSRGSQKRKVFLKRSRDPRPRPARTKAENFCLTAYMNINGKAAFALFDSGCTTEACSPDFARVAGIRVFPIKSEVTLQLGTAGSRSKINHGMTAMVEYDDIQSEEYLDIVNLDQFDMIVGTKFMRKHKMSLNFEFNTIRVCGVPSATLSSKEECSEVERRNTARRVERAE